MSQQQSALLILDFQEGVADQPFAAAALEKAQVALASARKHSVPVIFSRINFLPGYADIADSNRVFAAFKRKGMFPPGKSEVIAALQPQSGEVVLNKDRFSAFAGNALAQTLRAQNITNLVMAGLSTSGVILATFIGARDMDYSMTILVDACADPEVELHNALFKSLFARSADLPTTDRWVATLG